MREIGGFRMGPFELMDLIGHDVNFAVTSSIFAGFFYDRRYTPSITQQRLVDAAMLGRKTGRGFYDYRRMPRSPCRRDRSRARATRDLERILVMLINEAVDAVHWRVATPQDIDLAVQKGVNYPKGLLAWGEAIGWPHVLTGSRRWTGIRRGTVPSERAAQARSGPPVVSDQRPGQEGADPAARRQGENSGSAALAGREAGEAQALAEPGMPPCGSPTDSVRGWAWKIVSLAPEACTLRATVRAEMLNGFGMCHGGVTFHWPIARSRSRRTRMGECP